MSKLSTETLREAITAILAQAEEKKRNFQETIELQIGLKNYDTQKDKRFSGTVKLPNMPRPRMTACVLGDVKHCEEAAVWLFHVASAPLCALAARAARV